MIDCVVMECKDMPAGSRLHVTPLAAVLANGEKIIVKKALGANLQAQHHKNLKVGGSMQIERLAQGTWQLARGIGTSPGKPPPKKGPGSIPAQDKAVGSPGRGKRGKRK